MHRTNPLQLVAITAGYCRVHSTSHIYSTYIPQKFSPKNNLKSHKSQNFHIASIFYGIVMASLKIGILLHWSDIFVPKGFRNAFWWTTRVVLWINVVVYTICVFIEIFGCTPQEKIWNITVIGTCLDRAKGNVSTAIVNFISDVVILFLPQHVIWSLHMDMDKKLGIAALFAVGVLYVPVALLM